MPMTSNSISCSSKNDCFSFSNCSSRVCCHGLESNVKITEHFKVRSSGHGELESLNPVSVIPGVISGLGIKACWATLLSSWDVMGLCFLDDTSTFNGEKNASPNRNSARGFEAIDTIKANVEKACPSTVSCADILTLAAREAVYLECLFGPFLSAGEMAQQQAGMQLMSRCRHLFESLENITVKFTSKGLEMKDVVVRSGAHTIGFAQCFTFKTRLFDFNGSGKSDPDLDSSFLENLQSFYPDQDGSNSKLAPLNPVTTNKFDNVYFKNIMNNSGLLRSDQALIGSP